MSERKKLSDILQQNFGREKLEKAWRETEAAADFLPLPKGEYVFRILSGELFTSKRNNTPGYKLTLEVTEGEHEGRRAWIDYWLTPLALPMAKRDLAKLGITNLEQLEMPLPPGILIKGKLVLRKDDDGNESNQLKHFEFIGVEKGDAYEPEDLENTGGNQGDGRPLEPNSKPSPELAGNGNGQKTGEMFPFGDKGNGQDDRGKAFLAHERGGLTK